MAYIKTKSTPEPFEDIKTGKQYPIELSQKQWLFLFNILVGQQYRIGDAVIAWDILQKIKPIAAIDSNIKPKEEK